MSKLHFTGDDLCQLLMSGCDWDGSIEKRKKESIVVKSSSPWKRTQVQDGPTFLQDLAKFWIGFVQEWIPFNGPRKNRASMIKIGYGYKHSFEVSCKDVLNELSCFA